MSAPAVRPAAVAAMIAGALAAQAPLTTIGRFVDEQGRPVADAEVTFATSPPRVFDAFAPATVVTARTDADGRYRAALRTGCSYSAWAIGPAAAAGGRPRSFVREGVTAGNVVDFAVATRDPQDRLVVRDLGNAGEGPFTAIVRAGARHEVPLRLALSRDGTAALSPLPGVGLQVQLVDAHGVAVTPWLSEPSGTAYVPEPHRRRFVVRDEQGAPIAGAVVLCVDTTMTGGGGEPFASPRRFESVLRSAPTDASGRTELYLRGGQDLCLAIADGHATGITGRMGPIWVQDGAFGTDDVAALQALWDQEVTFALRRGTAIRGRLHRGSEPIAAHGVLLTTEIRVSKTEFGGTQSSSFAHEAVARTAADGTFALPPMAANAHCLQFALAPLGDDAPPVFMLPRSAAAAGALDFDLAAWPVVTFQGLGADGGPAADLRVVLLPGDPQAPVPDPLVLPADRAGRVRCQLEPGAWFVFATDGQDYAAQVCAIAAGAAVDARLHLQPLGRLRGTFVDAAQKPIAGCGFTVPAMQSTPTPADASPLELLMRQHAQLLTGGLVDRAQTDARGAFELRFVPAPGVTLFGWPQTQGHDCRIELRIGGPEQVELHAK